MKIFTWIIKTETICNHCDNESARTIFKKCTFLFWGEKYGMKLLKCNLSERHIFAAWWYRKEQQAWRAVETSEQRVALFPAEFLNIILCIFLQMTQSPCVSRLILPNYHFYACIPAGISGFGVNLNSKCLYHVLCTGREMAVKCTKWRKYHILHLVHSRRFVLFLNFG